MLVATALDELERSGACGRARRVIVYAAVERAARATPRSCRRCRRRSSRRFKSTASIALCSAGGQGVAHIIERV
jgi:hypothetical protein